MTNLVAESYLPILIFACLALGLGSAIALLPFFLSKKNNYKAKIAPYECGFETFSEPRKKFDIRFYLVAILFIIFDLEVAFLFPWAITFKKSGWIAFWSMMVFLAVLVVGFIYEWVKGALEWE